MGIPAGLRRRLGPAYRRLRREWQWRTCASDLDLSVVPADGFPHPIAAHHSPLLRRLAGLDMDLQRSKVTNLRLAAATLDGVVLAPGQRLSFWKQVGPPVARRGYVDGLVLVSGALTAGVGGGLCQLTNLLHWMTLHTPLTVVERWRHSYDVFPDAGRTVPFGSGATCAYPSLDLQIENRTASTFRLAVGVEGPDLRGSWHADVPATHRYEVYEASHLITHDGVGVYHRANVLRRRVLDLDGELVDDEFITHNQARMCYEPILGAGPVRPALG